MQNLLPEAADSRAGAAEGRRARAFPLTKAAPNIPLPDPAAQESLLLDVWLFVRRNILICACALVLGLGIAIAFSLSQTPVFRSTATLEIQDLNENFLNLKEVRTNSAEKTAASPDGLQTQLRILQSKTLISRVLDQLSPERIPAPIGIRAWRDRLLGSRPVERPNREQHLESASQRFAVKESRQARIVDLVFESPDAAYATAFVNKLAQQYIDQSIESRLQISQVTSDWLTRQLSDLRAQLQTAEGRLSTYTRKSRLVVMADRRSPEEDRLRQMQADLAKAQENRIAKQARLETALKAPADSLDAPLSSTLREYQTKLADLRRQRADLLAVFTPNYEGVKRLDAQIATLASASYAENTAILQSIRNDYDDAMRRENLLEGAYIKQVEAVSNEAEGLVGYGILQREVDSLRRLYETMMQRASEAKVAAALRASNARLLDPATIPYRPARPNLLLNLMWGGSAGLLLGLILATAQEQIDRRINQPGQLGKFLTVPELGVIPKLGPLPVDSLSKTISPGGLESHATVALASWTGRWTRQDSAESVAFRSVLTSILFSDHSGRPPQVIAITSAGPQEGKTTLVTNLAAALAHMKRKVLMIDGDMQTGRLHENFGQSVCLSPLFDLLALPVSNGAKEYVVQPTLVPGVFLMALGPREGSALDLLPVLGALLHRLRQEFDVVLIDSVSLGELPDARVLSRIADGVVLVVKSGVTSKDDVLTALKRLNQDGSRLLGAVLNCWAA